MNLNCCKHTAEKTLSRQALQDITLSVHGCAASTTQERWPVMGGSRGLVQYNKNYNKSHNETSHKQMRSRVTSPRLNSSEHRLNRKSWISLDNHNAYLDFEPMPATAYRKQMVGKTISITTLFCYLCRPSGRAAVLPSWDTFAKAPL